MKGKGFSDEECQLYMEICFNCGRENYALAVASGICAFCGYEMSEDDLLEVQKLVLKKNRPKGATLPLYGEDHLD